MAQSFLQRYGKPMMIGEYGTSSGGWSRINDPYLRGWRQGIWGGALGGSVGTAMSWWWENIDGENDYLVYASLGDLLNRTGWGRGIWTNIGSQYPQRCGRATSIAPCSSFSSLGLTNSFHNVIET